MSEAFVLVTGAWHGGWAWRPVAQHLRAAGHRVLTPTLPGLADGDDPRAHSLADVVDFVVDVIESNDLTDVTLVGHSWGGYPVTGASHRLRARLRKLVYWSAFVPAEGHDLLVPQPLQYFTETVRPIDPAAPPAPLAYVLSTEDVALPPGDFAWNPRFPQRLGVTASLTPGSHEACFTRPAELADALLKA